MQARCNIIIYGFVLIVALTIGLLFIQHGFDFWYLGFLLVAAVAALFALRWVNRAFVMINRLNDLMVQVSEGCFDQRITRIAPLGELSEMAWHFNDMLDQLEPYFREVDVSFAHVREGKFHRKTQMEGLHGQFAISLKRINQSFDVMEESVNCVQKNELFSELSSLNINNMLQKLKHIQGDMMSVNEQMSEAGMLSRETTVEADNAQQSIDEILKMLGKIMERVEATSTAIDQLNNRSVEMADVISMIAGVADQTNLLALNAAIEAARAGEHGRGFAVVADEVRNLAANTKTATDKITNLIGQITDDVGNMLEDSVQMKNMAEESHQHIEEFGGKFMAFSEAAARVCERVTLTQRISFSSMVKVDHMVFMQNGYLATWNGADSPEGRAVHVDHHNCRLGKWYYEGAGKEQFSNTHAYRNLESPHGMVHLKVQEGIAAVAMNWQKDGAIKSSIIQSFTEAEIASEEVMHLMTEMASVLVARHQHD